MTSKDLGRIFRDAREVKGFSVRETAAQSRIHDNVIKDIETGDFERLGKVYIKGFIKKYSDFLELDTDDILQKFTDLSSSIEDRKFRVEKKPPAAASSNKPSFSLPEFKVPKISLPKISIPRMSMPKVNIDLNKKQLQQIAVGVLSVVFVVLLLVFINMMRSRLSEPQKMKRAPKTPAPVKKAAPKQVEKTPVKKVSKPAPAGTGSVNLTITATGEVWLKVVNSAREQLYVGTLKPGQSKTWKADDVINVWTGNAGNLDFKVNNRSLGTVAAGVVKNIRVSSEGVRVGTEWVERLD